MFPPHKCRSSPKLLLLPLMIIFVFLSSNPVLSASLRNESSPSSHSSTEPRHDTHTPEIHLDVSSNEITTLERPLYNIAHMCNSIKTTLSALQRGANAVEVDVNFNRDELYLYHGYPCDCFRYCWDAEPLARYLVYMRKITTPANRERYQANFVLLYFDLKLSEYDASEKWAHGVRMANYLERYFFDKVPVQSRLKLILSLSYSGDVDFLWGFLDRMKKLDLFEHVKDYLGFDVGMDSNLDNIKHMWSQLNVSNVWQGEGITNCINPLIGHTLDKLVHERNSPRSPITKVYRWTVDLTDSLKTALRHDIDGIMTNHPERVVRMLRDEDEFRGWYRIATNRDDPYEKRVNEQDLIVQADNSAKPVQAVHRPGHEPEPLPKPLPIGGLVVGARPKSTNRLSKESLWTLWEDLKESMISFAHEIVKKFF